MELTTIGYVRNTVQNRREMTAFGVPSAIEILPEFADALRCIEKHSHIWVLGWIDRGERDLLQVIPRGGRELHGIFAVRSPARPNPIGLTAAKLLQRNGLVLHVDSLDFIDGTPVLDIKPYFAARDMIFSATSKDTGRSKNHVESLEFQAERFHGFPHPDISLAARLLAQFRETHGAFDGWTITAPQHRPIFVDAVMGATRDSLGRGTLILGIAEELVFERFEQRIVIPLV